jgi:hypothetical protein
MHDVDVDVYISILCSCSSPCLSLTLSLSAHTFSFLFECETKFGISAEQSTTLVLVYGCCQASTREISLSKHE